MRALFWLHFLLLLSLPSIFAADVLPIQFTPIWSPKLRIYVYPLADVCICFISGTLCPFCSFIAYYWGPTPSRMRSLVPTLAVPSHPALVSLYVVYGSSTYLPMPRMLGCHLPSAFWPMFWCSSKLSLFFSLFHFLHLLSSAVISPLRFFRLFLSLVLLTLMQSVWPFWHHGPPFLLHFVELDVNYDHYSLFCWIIHHPELGALAVHHI